MRFVKRISDRGNLTLPTELRDALGISEGDIVEFDVIGIVKKGRTTSAGRASHPIPPNPQENPA